VVGVNKKFTHTPTMMGTNAKDCPIKTRKNIVSGGGKKKLTHTPTMMGTNAKDCPHKNLNPKP